VQPAISCRVRSAEIIANSNAFTCGGRMVISPFYQWRMKDVAPHAVSSREESPTSVCTRRIHTTRTTFRYPAQAQRCALHRSAGTPLLGGREESESCCA
jgi:hypothetical protein